MNLRPSGYEPDELPGCSTPRKVRGRMSGDPGAGPDGREASRAGGKGRRWRNCWLGLATTRSPTVRTAVPWARRGFTAEFGMGSGGAPAL